MKGAAGNALFLILIAVALFAALSYAVTNSGRGGGSIDREKASLIASQLIQYMGMIDRAIIRIRTVNQCRQNQISFVYDSNEDGVITGGDSYYNPNSDALADSSCRVFSPEGGNITRIVPEAEIFDTTFEGIAHPNIYSKDFKYDPATCMRDAPSNPDCSVAPRGDLIMKLSFVQKELCEAVNRQLKMPIPPLANGTINDTGSSGFWRGQFNNSFQMIATADGSFAPTGCVRFTHTSGGPLSYMI